MAIEIMDMDASEIPEAPPAPTLPQAGSGNADALRRFERELRRRGERIARRMAY